MLPSCVIFFYVYFERVSPGGKFEKGERKETGGRKVSSASRNGQRMRFTQLDPWLSKGLEKTLRYVKEEIDLAVPHKR